MSRRQSIGRFTALALGLAALLAACEPQKTLTISGVTPNKGKFIGGDHVSINGTGFQASGQQGVTVYFGDKKATNCSIDGPTKITCETPAGEKDTDVSVKVQFDDARVKELPKAFRYYDPTANAPGIDQLVGDKK